MNFPLNRSSFLKLENMFLGRLGVHFFFSLKKCKNAGPLGSTPDKDLGGHHVVKWCICERTWCSPRQIIEKNALPNLKRSTGSFFSSASIRKNVMDNKRMAMTYPNVRTGSFWSIQRMLKQKSAWLSLIICVLHLWRVVVFFWRCWNLLSPFEFCSQTTAEFLWRGGDGGNYK